MKTLSLRQACLLVFADVAGLCSKCCCLYFIASRGQGGQMLRSLGNSLQTHSRPLRSGAEGSKRLGGQDRDTLLFLELCLVLLFCFSLFLIPLCPRNCSRH